MTDRAALVDQVAGVLRRYHGEPDHQLAARVTRVVGDMLTARASRVAVDARLESSADVERLGCWLAARPSVTVRHILMLIGPAPDDGWPV